jgi:Jagunal, ER re-organisation during oogenesis
MQPFDALSDQSLMFKIVKVWPICLNTTLDLMSINILICSLFVAFLMHHLIWITSVNQNIRNAWRLLLKNDMYNRQAWQWFSICVSLIIQMYFKSSRDSQKTVFDYFRTALHWKWYVPSVAQPHVRIGNQLRVLKSDWAIETTFHLQAWGMILLNVLAGYLLNTQLLVRKQTNSCLELVHFAITRHSVCCLPVWQCQSRNIIYHQHLLLLLIARFLYDWWCSLPLLFPYHNYIFSYNFSRYSCPSWFFRRLDMASRFGSRPTGSDGNDFLHREHIASHYQARFVEMSIKWNKLFLVLTKFCE